MQVGLWRNFPIDREYNTEYINCVSPQYVQNFERKDQAVL